MLSGCPAPLGVGVRGWGGLTPSCWSRIPEGWVQAGSVPSKCICFPLLCTRIFASEEWRADVNRAHVWTEIWWATCIGVHGLTQTQPLVQVSFNPHSRSLPPAASALFWNCPPGWRGPAWTLSLRQELSYGTVATTRGLDGFWGPARQSVSSGYLCATQAFSQGRVISAPPWWVSSLVTGALDPVPCCGMEWAELISSLSLGWGAQWGVHRRPSSH